MEKANLKERLAQRTAGRRADATEKPIKLTDAQNLPRCQEQDEGEAMMKKG